MDIPDIRVRLYTVVLMQRGPELKTQPMWTWAA